MPNKTDNLIKMFAVFFRAALLAAGRSAPVLQSALLNTEALPYLKLGMQGMAHNMIKPVNGQLGEDGHYTYVQDYEASLVLGALSQSPNEPEELLQLCLGGLVASELKSVQDDAAKKYNQIWPGYVRLGDIESDFDTLQDKESILYSASAEVVINWRPGRQFSGQKIECLLKEGLPDIDLNLSARA